jgi:plastocyanin
MKLPSARTALALTAAATLLTGPVFAADPRKDWLREEMPLPLVVRTPEDLSFKTAAERQYLIFNLLAGGRIAYDAGDMGTAAERWGTLLRMRSVPADVKAAVRPLAADARRRALVAGKSLRRLDTPKPAEPPDTVEVQAPETPKDAVALAVEPARAELPAAPEVREAPRPAVEVRRARPVPAGVVQGVVTGGAGGAGGAVVWLKRADGTTPRPKPAPRQVIQQRDKKFFPHVLAVPVGTEVVFQNEDGMFHNVFSLSRPNDFDLGMYEKGVAREKVFTQPGPVSLLCNIHSSMSAFVYVVDSPWYTQADAQGRFKLRGVPPGEYVLHSWHESSAKPSTRPITVGGTAPLVVAASVTADAERLPYVPDKAGKPRQGQLGY